MSQSFKLQLPSRLLASGQKHPFVALQLLLDLSPLPSIAEYWGQNILCQGSPVFTEPLAWLEVNGNQHEIFSGKNIIGRDPDRCKILIPSKVSTVVRHQTINFSLIFYLFIFHMALY
ncbi:hypothetical protein E2C01_075437 [Portunus trituberculatus]|uniref:Uncharacterized protein n=1 Tax=Portunus trituberculatus TaxID=210409 RepID=A0A5B7IK57_PORTR|nr:hypothetical protein [Portunus trituberculatus]